MKKYLKLVGVFLGAFVATSCVMMMFEYANHLLYPFPLELETHNLLAVQEFGKTMPTFAFVVILLGWLFGTLLGVWILEKYLKVENANTKLNVIYGYAALLTVLAIWNNYMFVGLGNRLWFEVLTIPFFFTTTYLTIKYFK